MTMAAVTPAPDPQATRSQRWLARLSFVLLGLTIALVVVLAGLRQLAGISGSAASTSAQ